MAGGKNSAPPCAEKRAMVADAELTESTVSYRVECVCLSFALRGRWELIKFADVAGGVDKALSGALVYMRTIAGPAKATQVSK